MQSKGSDTLLNLTAFQHSVVTAHGLHRSQIQVNGGEKLNDGRTQAHPFRGGKVTSRDPPSRMGQKSAVQQEGETRSGTGLTATATSIYHRTFSSNGPERSRISSNKHDSDAPSRGIDHATKSSHMQRPLSSVIRTSTETPSVELPDESQKVLWQNGKRPASASATTSASDARDHKAFEAPLESISLLKNKRTFNLSMSLLSDPTVRNRFPAMASAVQTTNDGSCAQTMNEAMDLSANPAIVNAMIPNLPEYSDPTDQRNESETNRRTMSKKSTQARTKGSRRDSHPGIIEGMEEGINEPMPSSFWKSHKPVSSEVFFNDFKGSKQRQGRLPTSQRALEFEKQLETDDIRLPMHPSAAGASDGNSMSLSQAIQRRFPDSVPNLEDPIEFLENVVSGLEGDPSEEQQATSQLMMVKAGYRGLRKAVIGARIERQKRIEEQILLSHSNQTQTDLSDTKKDTTAGSSSQLDFSTRDKGIKSFSAMSETKQAKNPTNQSVLPSRWPTFGYGDYDKSASTLSHTLTEKDAVKIITSMQNFRQLSEAEEQVSHAISTSSRLGQAALQSASRRPVGESGKLLRSRTSATFNQIQRAKQVSNEGKNGTLNEREIRGELTPLITEQLPNSPFLKLGLFPTVSSDVARCTEELPEMETEDRLYAWCLERAGHKEILGLTSLGSQISGLTGAGIAAMLSHPKGRVSLASFKQCCFDLHSVIGLCDGIKVCKSLQRLDLDWAHGELSTARGLNLLATSLSKNQTIEIISCAGLPLGSAEVAWSFAKSLGDMASLKWLSLIECDINNMSAASFGQEFSRNIGAQEGVCLAMNSNLSNQGIFATIKPLCATGSNCSIIDLSHCGIGKAGLSKGVVDLLNESPALEHLNLSSCGIEDTSNLKQYVVGSKILKSLNLNDNIIHDDKIEWLGELGSNKSLVQLEIRNNRLSNDSASRIIKMLIGDPTKAKLVSEQGSQASVILNPLQRADVMVPETGVDKEPMVVDWIGGAPLLAVIGLDGNVIEQHLADGVKALLERRRDKFAEIQLQIGKARMNEWYEGAKSRFKSAISRRIDRVRLRMTQAKHSAKLRMLMFESDELKIISHLRTFPECKLNLLEWEQLFAGGSIDRAMPELYQLAVNAGVAADRSAKQTAESGSDHESDENLDASLWAAKRLSVKDQEKQRMHEERLERLKMKKKQKTVLDQQGLKKYLQGIIDSKMKEKAQEEARQYALKLRRLKEGFHSDKNTEDDINRLDEEGVDIGDEAAQDSSRSDQAAGNSSGNVPAQKLQGIHYEEVAKLRERARKPIDAEVYGNMIAYINSNTRKGLSEPPHDLSSVEWLGVCKSVQKFLIKHYLKRFWLQHMHFVTLINCLQEKGYARVAVGVTVSYRSRALEPDKFDNLVKHFNEQHHQQLFKEEIQRHKRKFSMAQQTFLQVKRTCAFKQKSFEGTLADLDPQNSGTIRRPLAIQILKQEARINQSKAEQVLLVLDPASLGILESAVFIQAMTDPDIGLSDL